MEKNVVPPCVWRTGKNSHIKILLGIFLMIVSCHSPCSHEIEIYQGSVFKAGQSYSVEIENEVVTEESFLFGKSTGKYTKKATYCCNLDSCRVRFILDGSDTVFYVRPSKVNKFVVGSDYRGNHSVATNEDKEAWMEM